MWLSILIFVGIVGGLALAVAGGGIFGFVFIFLGVVGLALKFGSAFAGQSPNAGEHAERGERLERGEPTGVAHEGQAHMTPEQISQP